MSTTVAGLLQIALLLALLAVCHRPLGDHIARTLTSPRHLRVERGMYRLVRVDPDADQRWSVYALSAVGFSLASVLLLYGLQRIQHLLPLSLGRDPVAPDLAFNTAVSFAANTNWQAYSGEQTMGHLVQMTGLTVQNFVSAAVGIAVAVALVRGFTRHGTDRVGNFWVDLTRATLRILLPLAVVGAVVLLVAGAIQNLGGEQTITTLSGGTQSVLGGPVASQEAIKLLGTNGGGFFNANSAHPFENPTPFSNLFQVFLVLLVPSAMPRALGTMLGNRRQGYAILATMAVLWAASVALVTWAEVAHGGTVPQAVGAATEGKEQQLGIWGSTLFAASTTATSTGAVNSFHDSYTAAGGGVTLVNMMLGEVSPGGVGSGLYGMLVLAVLAVFLAGLMVGRTPSFLGKRIGRQEITLVALYLLAVPFVLLVGAAIAIALPSARASMLNTDMHGFTEVLYAYTSAANNNGSAFAGIGVNTPFYNTTLGIAMAVGRLVPLVLVLALAGALARQRTVATDAGSLPTAGPLFVGLLAVVTVVVTALTYFPALALGPIAEALL